MRLFFQKKIYCKLKMGINFFEAIQNFIRKEYRQRKHFVGDPPTQFTPPQHAHQMSTFPHFYTRPRPRHRKFFALQIPLPKMAHPNYSQTSHGEL